VASRVCADSSPCFSPSRRRKSLRLGIMDSTSGCQPPWPARCAASVE
jgi:hypothetical protein